MGAVESAFRLIDVGCAQRCSQILQTHSVGCELGRIGLDAHRGSLAAADADKAYAGELRNLLGQRGVRQVLDFGEREGLRGKGKSENGRVGGIDLAVDGRIG